MRKLSFILLFIFHFSFDRLSFSGGGNLSAQIISTYAGNGISGYSGDGGSAINAEMYYPFDVIFNKSDNMYVAEGNRVEMVMISSGIISRFAGGGSVCCMGNNGVADTSAIFSSPGFLGIDDSGNIYIPDGPENVVYKVTVSTGIIAIIAGLGGSLNKGYSGDGGLATAARLDDPSAIAVDDTGNLYIADFDNNVIRKVTVSTGAIITVVGNGYGYWRGAGTWTGAYYGDGGAATSAELYGPQEITIDDSANIYIADSRNCAIRKVTKSTNIISTVAGNGTIGYTGDGGQAINAELFYPAGICFDKSGNLYIADANNVVRKVTTNGIITTIAGNGYNRGGGVGGYSGNGGPATNAELNQPAGICFDTAGNLYVADSWNYVVRKVTYDTNTVTGVNKLKAKSEEVRVFPNPSNGVFQFEIRNYELGMKCNVEVFNYLGEKVYSQSYKPSSAGWQIDLSGQPNGVYLYRVIKETGELVGEGKIIIDK